MAGTAPLITLYGACSCDEYRRGGSRYIQTVVNYVANDVFRVTLVVAVITLLTLNRKDELRFI